MAGPETGESGEALIELVQRIAPGGRLLEHWQLTGGVSAELTALEIELPDGRVERFVVRRYGETDLWQNPQVAKQEFSVLDLARAHGVPAPRRLYLDEGGGLRPSPFIVIEYVDGETDFDPSNLAGYLSQMATVLAGIHRIQDAPALSTLPALGSGFGPRPATLDDTLNEGAIRDALESAWPLPDANEQALLHGDFWPGNVLWRAGEIAAVIDWEDARVGDPLADVANCRLELLWSFGENALETFTDAYRASSTIDVANLPYWDLVAALRPCSKLSTWGLDPDTERRMRAQHTQFVSRALATLAT